MDKVYKYRPLSAPWSLRLLERNELRFSCPNVFNDPFDCRIPVHFEDATHAQVVEVFAEVKLLDDPELGPEEARARVERELRAFDPADHGQAAAMRRRFGESLNRLFGIVSLSGVPDDLLMWSHYAEAHHGYCVGLSAPALEAWGEQMKAQNHEIRLVEVTYSRDMPYLNPQDHSRSDLILTTVSTKAHPWSYEREYRLLGVGLSGRSVEMPPGILCEVIMGHMIRPEHRERLIEALRRRGDGLPLLQARTHETAFGLVMHPVDY